jgi:hypothetical protein
MNAEAGFCVRFVSIVIYCKPTTFDICVLLYVNVRELCFAEEEKTLTLVPPQKKKQQPPHNHCKTRQTPHTKLMFKP